LAITTASRETPDWEADSFRTAAFHDTIAAGYDRRHISNPRGLLARRTFQELVSRYVAPGSRLLDFGCGTGLDAAAYARLGYKVTAYDNSPGMIAQLEQCCQAEIAAGTIVPVSMPYSSFLKAVAEWPKSDAVVADFAVLNAVRDLPILFETFNSHLVSGGTVIISLLNPTHWSRITKPVWWKNCFIAGWSNPISIDPFSTYLHPTRRVLRAARGFSLTGRANAGSSVRCQTGAPPDTLRFYRTSQEVRVDALARLMWRSPLYRFLGHFVFLILTKNP
jgi:SAM-dependent methyltransferase